MFRHIIEMIDQVAKCSRRIVSLAVLPMGVSLMGGIDRNVTFLVHPGEIHHLQGSGDSCFRACCPHVFTHDGFEKRCELLTRHGLRHGVLFAYVSQCCPDTCELVVSFDASTMLVFAIIVPVLEAADRP